MLSVVTSIYKTAQFVEPFAARIDAAARSCGLPDYEIIFVVDGSPDNALAILRKLKQSNPRIRAIELSRNFGHHPALWCGLERAGGDLIFLADSDLETPPEILADLHAAMLDRDVDVAFAWDSAPAAPWRRRWTSRAFWRVFSALAEVRIPPNILTERLMRRRYAHALLGLQERSLFLAGAMQWVGFRQVAVPATRTRRAGSPSYSWARRAALAFDAITSFSVAPMKILFAAGLCLAAITFFAAAFLVALRLARPAFVLPGFTALAVLMLFSLGAILAAIGLTGLYLGKVFVQSKARPIYVVREEF